MDNQRKTFPQCVCYCNCWFFRGASIQPYLSGRASSLFILYIYMRIMFVFDISGMVSSPLVCLYASKLYYTNSFLSPRYLCLPSLPVNNIIALACLLYVCTSSLQGQDKTRFFLFFLIVVVVLLFLV